MTKSETIGALAKALAIAQGELKPAKKMAKNPYFNSTYADLAEIMESCRAALAKNGLSVVQGVGGDGTTVTITTMLLHESGEWIMSELTFRPKDSGPQAIGSAITYGRRYALAAMVGIVADADDDGNAAEGRKAEPKVKARPEPEPKPDNVIALKPDNGNGAKPAAGKQAIIEEIIAAIKRRAGADKKVKLQLINETFGCDWAAVIQLEEPRLLAGLSKLNCRTKDFSAMTKPRHSDGKP